MTGLGGGIATLSVLPLPACKSLIPLRFAGKYSDRFLMLHTTNPANRAAHYAGRSPGLQSFSLKISSFAP
jgi:hypothetical protein